VRPPGILEPQRRGEAFVGAGQFATC
jgi:hypothetical protein